MKKHLAFVNAPAPGHVNPTLPLVEELVRRGHRISYATGSSMLGRVEAAGADPVALPSELPTPPPTVDFTPETLALMLEHFLADAQQTFPRMIEQFEHDRPDAVCYDMLTFTGRMLANKLGLPAIALVPNFAANENFSLQDKFMPDSFDLEHPKLVEFRKRMQDFAEQYGVTVDPRPMGGTPAALNLVFIPKQFQLAAETFDERFRFLGPSIGAREHEQWQPARPDTPVLFISLGTAFNNRPDFYRMCFEAFGDNGPDPTWQVAMSVGDHVDSAELGQAPANFDVRASFPQPAVLQHARVFLSHTGMNSTMESLYYGVPLVAVPQMPEQFANASRTEELGLGRRLLTEEITAEQLRTTADEVAGNEEIRAHVVEMQRLVRDSGGAVAGADALEEHLA
jgi:MGT family glycosyltransferase